MTTAPGTYNFTIYQGATFSRILTWKDENGDLIDLTGFTARMQIRKKIDGDLLADMTTANSKIALGGAAGTITLSLTASETAAINSSKGVYDLELVSGGGIVTRLVQGDVTFSKEVTK